MHYYYSEGHTKDILFSNAIVSFIGVLILCYFNIIIFFDLTFLIPFKDSDTPKYIQYLVILLVTLPATLILQKLFRKEDVMKLDMIKRERRVGYNYSLLFIFSLIELFVFVVFSRVTIDDLF
jgi:hypothetical protein